MQASLVDLLECPACHGELTWNITDGHDDRIETADVRCSACVATYPVREGIGVFLTPDLPRDDLWEQVESRLAQHLRQHPCGAGRSGHRHPAGGRDHTGMVYLATK